MVEHLKGVYPYEGCGLMLGKGDRITKVCSVENRRKERANDRYEMDGRDILRIEKEASSEGLDVVGFFHSHPDHPDRPSEFDRERGMARIPVRHRISRKGEQGLSTVVGTLRCGWRVSGRWVNYRGIEE